MGEALHTRPRGPARTDRPRAGAFGRLAARATEDPAAAETLTLAWCEHGPVERRRLAEALVRDAAARGADPAPLLRLWAALEPEPALREALATLATRAEPPFRAFAARAGGRALLVLARGRGPTVEALVIESEIAGTAVSVRLHPRLREEELAAFRPQPWAPSVTAAARLLWRFRRSGGRLPEVARGFARAFDVPASPWPS